MLYHLEIIMRNTLKSLQKYEDAEKILKGIDLGKYPNYINAINNLANLKKDMKKYEEGNR